MGGLSLLVRHPGLARPIPGTQPLHLVPQQEPAPSAAAAMPAGGTPSTAAHHWAGPNAVFAAADDPLRGEVSPGPTVAVPKQRAPGEEDPAAGLWEGRRLPPPLTEREVSLIRQAARRRSLGLDPGEPGDDLSSPVRSPGSTPPPQAFPFCLLRLVFLTFPFLDNFSCLFNLPCVLDYPCVLSH